MEELLQEEGMMAFRERSFTQEDAGELRNGRK
jgi:hypothetical protein